MVSRTGASLSVLVVLLNEGLQGPAEGGVAGDNARVRTLFRQASSTPSFYPLSFHTFDDWSASVPKSCQAEIQGTLFNTAVHPKSVYLTTPETVVKMDWEPVVKRLDREIENIETSIWGEGGVLITKAGDDDWVNATSEWEKAQKEVQNVVERYGNISYQVQEVSDGAGTERRIIVSTVSQIEDTDE